MYRSGLRRHGADERRPTRSTFVPVTAGVFPDENSRFFFVGIDKARFRKPVEPGDQLILKAELQRTFKGIWRFSTVAEVGGEEVASAEMMMAPDVQNSGTSTGG